MGGRLGAVDVQAPYLIVIAVLGLLFGSFLNVCIYRIPRDLSVVAPRSFCPECGTQISWRDNIPLLSYFILRGKCRFCGKPIGIRYPLVELTTALTFVAVAVEYGWTVAAFKWSVFEAVLIVLFWTDLDERILPDELTLGGAAVGLIFTPFVPIPGVFADLLLPGSRPVWRSLLNAGLGVLLLAGPIWLLAILYARVRKREVPDVLGMGDLKLILLMEVFLGLEKGLLAALIGTISGSVLGITYIWLRRKEAGKYELPFGTFLCAGAALVPLVTK